MLINFETGLDLIFESINKLQNTVTIILIVSK